MKRNRLFALVFSALFMASCASHYERTLLFQENIRTGNLEKANDILDKDKILKKDKNRLLYLMNKGYVNHLMSQYAESNKMLDAADLLMEDQRKNIGSEALALISNPGVRPYVAEDFERILVNYYKALNYLELGQRDEALVECRRINLVLQKLNEKYPEHKNKYSDDAFAHIMMGLVYDSQRNYNDAFIAFRNAYNLFVKDGSGSYMGVQMPAQLRTDLLRTAYLTGLYEEQRYYEKIFGYKYVHEAHEGGELVFFWENGLGPVKDEWSINFTVVKGAGGNVTFENDEMGLSFNFPMSQSSGSGNFSDLSLLRVAFPKYVERTPLYQRAELQLGDTTYELEEVEDINALAFQCLNDRFLREMANSLLRLAIKKAAEAAISKENKDLGALASLVNGFTEKADTRNWQTLPYNISYARIPLQEGDNTILLNKINGDQTDQVELHFEGRKGQTQFFMHHSLESLPLKTQEFYIN